jgi:predicted esterase
MRQLRKDEFRELSNRLFEFYNKRKYADALDVAVQAEKQFPDKSDLTQFWIACLQSRLEEYDNAVRTLRQALLTGVWWSEDWLLGDSDILPLQSREDFREILTECEKRRREAEANCKPGLTILTPSEYHTAGAYPLLIALHGRGNNDSDFATPWKAVLAKGMILAVPRSSQPMSSQTYRWDDLAKAEQEIVAAYSTVSNSCSIDARKVILAGFSQGGALAIYLCLKRSLPSVGFAAVAPSLSISPQGSEEWPTQIRSNKGKGLRGWLSIGDRDPHFENMKALRAEMDKVGLDCHFSIEEGLGHEYSKGFDQELGSAIHFLLG